MVTNLLKRELAEMLWKVKIRILGANWFPGEVMRFFKFVSALVKISFRLQSRKIFNLAENKYFLWDHYLEIPGGFAPNSAYGFLTQGRQGFYLAQDRIREMFSLVTILPVAT